jgi:hypothetical protein
MHLDSTTSQDGGACLACSLKAVDEEHFFVTMWWAIHTTLPKRARALFRKGDSSRVCAEEGRESSGIPWNKAGRGRMSLNLLEKQKAPVASRGYWSFGSLIGAWPQCFIMKQEPSYDLHLNHL